MVSLKPPDRSGVKRSNTNNTNTTETPTCFNKFRPSEIGKTDRKKTVSMKIEHRKNLKKSNRHCLFITVFYFLIFITADFHFQIGRIDIFLPEVPEIARIDVRR